VGTSGGSASVNRATLDLGHGVTPGTNVSFSGRITGDANAVITVQSVLGTGGQSYGGALFFGQDNSATYFGKWLLKSGEIRPDPGSTGGGDLMLGAIPGSPQSDNIKLDGASLRGPATI